MVDPQQGIVAVLDWEGAHIGDALRNLGWLCTNSWRFGVIEREVGGFGDLDDFLTGYTSVSGTPVDKQRVQFWIVYGSFNWAIGCLSMAKHYRTGPDATVERPAIRRRSSECQLDCANLLIPGKVELPHVNAAPTSGDMPRNDELLTSVRDFLRGDVMAETQGRTNFLARGAANSLDILLREATTGPAYQDMQRQQLTQLLDTSGEIYSLKAELCQQLRDGQISLHDTALQDHLRFATLTQAMIDQPNYSGVHTAMTAT